MYYCKNNSLIKNALIAIICNLLVALLFPCLSINLTVESVFGKNTGGIIMFILVILTQNKTKEEIATSIINIQWIGILIPFILLAFIVIGQFHLHFFRHILLGIIFFNLAYFSLSMKEPKQL